jgi:hypothetical protein
MKEYIECCITETHGYRMTVSREDYIKAVDIVKEELGDPDAEDALEYIANNADEFPSVDKNFKHGDMEIFDIEGVEDEEEV